MAYALSKLTDKNYAAKMEPLVEEMNQNTTTVLEWIQEDLPLEDKDGQNLIAECQALYNVKHATWTPTKSYLEKPSTAAIPQCYAGPAPNVENVLVFDDGRGFAQAILANAPQGRIGTRKIIQAPWDKESLTLDGVKELLGDGKSISMIIFGASCDIPASNAVPDVIEFQKVVVRLLFYIVKAIVDNELSIPKLCVLTRGAFAEEREIHEQVGLSLVMFACMHGFCNTARQELEETMVQYIDTEYFLDPPYWQTQDFGLRQRLASEVWRNQTFGKNHVRVLNSGRYVARNVWANAYAEAAGIQFLMPEPGQIISISGGNGALGIVMGMWLLDEAARQGKRDFEIQFLSRSMKISDLNMPNWKQVEAKAAALGVKAHQMKMDFSSQQAADDYLLSTNGQLFGFIHSAGVLEDSMVSNLTWQKFENSFNPKHRAAYCLHDAFGRLPSVLSFFWAFSSVAVQGNMGQLNYSTSNAALDGLARHRRALGLPAQTQQWGGWGEVGMASTMDEANKRRMNMGPMPSFSTKFGLDGLALGLKANVPTYAVYAQNPEAFLPMVQPEEGRNRRDTASQQYLRNFVEVIMPPPPPSANDDTRAEHLHRHLSGGEMFMNPNRDMLVWKNYIKPVMDVQYDTGPACGISVAALKKQNAIGA